MRSPSPTSASAASAATWRWRRRTSTSSSSSLAARPSPTPWAGSRRAALWALMACPSRSYCSATASSACSMRGSSGASSAS
eukprot:4944556-Lingulodinium_polyedra.AAC.1